MAKTYFDLEEGAQAELDFEYRSVRLSYKGVATSSMTFADAINLAGAVVTLTGLQRLSDMENAEIPLLSAIRENYGIDSDHI